MAKYVIRGGVAGYERLRVLARTRAADTAELLQEVGVQPGWRCVDLGCGGGAVTLELARLTAPEGRVLGLDMDDVKLELARTSAAEQGLSNVEFRSGDVTAWSEPSSYDLAYCRFLLEHVSAPVDLLSRMWESVRPGGVLAVEDADFEGTFCDPPNAGFDFWAAMYPAVLRRAGGDPLAGRSLQRWFREVRIADPHVRLRQEAGTDGEAKSLPLGTVEATAEAIEAEGLATAAEIEVALESLAAFTADPTTLIAGPRIFQVWARKPVL